jgi:CubicO group peptidase (beta-lactamase class C family)
VAGAYPYNRRHAPSSTLNTNIVDLARFSAAMLNQGTLGDSKIIGANALAAMWSPAWTSTDDPNRQASHLANLQTQRQFVIS